jgi:nucleotide-binding universal stress UspA family protein
MTIVTFDQARNMSVIPEPLSGGQHFPPAADRFIMDNAQVRTMHLLVPIKKSSDAMHGAWYIDSLIRRSIHVRVTLLHVMPPRQNKGLMPFFRPDNWLDDAHAEALTREASSLLEKFHQTSQLTCNTCIVSGDLVFAILDTAEMLNCTEIVFPVVKPTLWRRWFAGNLAAKVTQSARNIPVVALADTPFSTGN